MKIASVATALPPHRYDQGEITRALRAHWEKSGRFRGAADRLEALHGRVLVGGRCFALPLETLLALERWSEANAAWVESATPLGVRAVNDALAAAGVPPDRVGALFFVSVTGLSTPSIDARVMNALALPPHVKRVPIFGLGCVAGAAGLARAADYVRAFPDQAAVLLSVELCSLTLQDDDVSIANLIATGLFGDGAAAAVVAGERVPLEGAALRGPRIADTRSVFYPDTLRVMGWDVTDRGFRVVLSPEVPDVVRRHLRGDVDAFLASRGLSRRDVGAWVCHPGGPRVIEAVGDALELDPAALEPSLRSLREVGNLSSASVLFVLADFLERRPAAGTVGCLLAMGPGFCSELLLLEW